MTTTKLRSKRAGFFSRFAAMAKVGLRMMFHDKLKMAGTLFGVVFAVVLSNQQLGTFLGLIYKNQMMLEITGMDLWIIPAGAETFAPGKVLPVTDAAVAETTPGVVWAEPMLLGASTVKLPKGGTEGVTVVGTKFPRRLESEWQLINGSLDSLNRPDTMIFEDSERETLGGMNLGSVREVGNRNVTVGGFTYGLIPFGPSYALADYELARELLKTPNDQASYIAVRAQKGANLQTVKAGIQSKMSSSVVVTKDEFKGMIVKNILTKTAIGITFGTSTIFGLIVGFVIVSLSMFSSVVDNIREFGTLKAIGVTNGDLGMLLFVQSLAYGGIGSILGLALVTRMAAGIRSAKLALVLPPWLTFGTFFVMIGMCIFASSLALLRLRRVEPAMVFR
jgi:putative ABC transport system permease protein